MNGNNSKKQPSEMEKGTVMTEETFNKLFRSGEAEKKPFPIMLVAAVALALVLVIATLFSFVAIANATFADMDEDALAEYDTPYYEDEAKVSEAYHEGVRVLTYAGMKDASELQIPYNPVWDQLQVSSWLSMRSLLRTFQRLLMKTAFQFM